MPATGDSREIRTSVLIVGGGPVGLALATELGRLGVECLLVEARDGTINTPKMNFVNVRTMEFCRRWGLTEIVRRTGHPEDFRPNVLWVTSVVGHEIARIDFPTFAEEKTRFVSPAADCLISQLWFDPILLAHARTLPSVTLRHMTRLDGFEESADGIVARITDVVSGRSETVLAAYLVGCDGANSTVRGGILGIELDGMPALRDNFHIFFNSTELLELFERRHGQARFCSIVGPDGIWSQITSINWRGLWRFGMQPPPRDESQVAELIRRAVGQDFAFELLNSSHWISRKLVARSFGTGRAFIAGDAAHQHNPSGGFGMNTGIGDALDLAWKLWASLAGWGGPLLAASYDAERRPVGARNADEATRNLFLLDRITIDEKIGDDSAEGERQRAAFRQELFDADILRQHDSDGIALGYRYENSPILWPDGTAAPPDSVMEYRPTTRPGHRAPHAWLDGGPPPSAGMRLPAGRSTLDLFGNGFVLLGAGAPAEQCAPLIEAARQRGVPLTLGRVDGEEAIALYGRRFVLVRPDGHVAWRADAPPADALAVIDRVRGA